MHSSLSILRTAVDRVRTLLDEPDIDAKFTDNHIVNEFLGPAVADVISRVNNTNSAQIVLWHTITLVAGQTYYKLPPNIESVVQIVAVDSEGNKIWDAYPRDRMHRDGVGWSLEGNAGALELHIPYPNPTSMSIRVFYIPNGDLLGHLGDGTLAAVAGVDTITLDASPTLGLLDRRDNAYAGSVVRIIPVSPGAVEERIISRSYKSGSNWLLEVRRPFVETADGAVTYEILPAGGGSSQMWKAVSCHAAMEMGTGRKIDRSHYERLAQQYRSAIKTIGDNLTNLQGRVPPHIAKDTIDNPEGSPYILIWGS